MAFFDIDIFTNLFRKQIRGGQKKLLIKLVEKLEGKIKVFNFVKFLTSIFSRK